MGQHRDPAQTTEGLGFRPWFYPLIAVWPQFNYLTSLSLIFLMSKKWRTSPLPESVVQIRKEHVRDLAWPSIQETLSKCPCSSSPSHLPSVNISYLWLLVWGWLWGVSCLLACGQVWGSHWPGELTSASNAWTSAWECCHMHWATQRLLLDPSWFLSAFSSQGAAPSHGGVVSQTRKMSREKGNRA